MNTTAERIVKVLAEVVPDGGTALAQRAGPQALDQAQAIQGEIVPRLAANELTARAWQTFQQSPQAQATGLIAAVQLLLGADAALAQRLDALLDAYQRATGRTNTVNTGGGAYVAGHVTTNGGDFVGRDKHTTTTTITGDGNVIGDHSASTVIKQQGVDAGALAQAFAAFYQAVQQQPDLPPEDKEDLRAELQEVEAELQKGAEAREGFVRRRLRNIERMAPDIYDVVLATFANPVAGLGMVAKKIAEKMKAEAA